MHRLLTIHGRCSYGRRAAAAVTRERLAELAGRLPKKALVVDTNGTVEPGSDLVRMMKRRHVLLRASLDSMDPNDEVYLRRSTDGSGDSESKRLYVEKLDRISRMVAAGVPTAVQTVIYRRSTQARSGDPVFSMIDWLSTAGVRRWHLQRLVPAHLFRRPPLTCQLPTGRYELVAKQLAGSAMRSGIQVFAKRDRRHNCVFLLSGSGDVYTQGAAPGQKVRLGRLVRLYRSGDWFDYVSAADHAARYYLTGTS